MEYLKNLTKPELILVEVKELKPNPENPNRHSPEQINALANVFKYQGLRKPIIVSNQSGMIVTGHGTLEAIMQNGWEHAIIVKQDFDSYEQEYAHMVADNSLSNRSELDYAAINEKIIDLGPDFNLELLGIKDFNLDPDYSDFKEPDKKNDPELKIPDIKSCPNCGVVLANG